MSRDQSPGDSRSTWDRLSRVAVKGAEHDSPERQPHPRCLEGTRVELLKRVYGLLDDREKSRLIWMHGMAGVGKSAVAFTVAERMRGLKVTEETNTEKRLAGTFFFSRKHTKRCTTGYFFATLAYQLASNFPSVREDMNRAIRENPALLDPDKSLRHQVEAFFIQPLRRLRFRLHGCPPLTFVVDAFDECTSETDLADLILFLAQALREPGLPVTHILLTSRSESHICKAFQKDEVCSIPVNIFWEDVAAIISLDAADVDNDIYIFLEHSFRELQSRHCDFPQPGRDQLVRLASRAGGRFIVASTMMTFIDDRDHDPRDRLQLILELTNELLPGTETYKLYDCILSTCADPRQAYQHLSIVAALVDPLPISQISKLLGPGQGSDVETVLVQLRSVMDIPTDSSLPVNIYHSSVRDYALDPSNCHLPQAQYITSPHSLLARCSLRFMMRDIPESTALLTALSELKKQSQAVQTHDSQSLKDSLAFIVQPPEPLQVLRGLLWLRGHRGSDSQSWLETLDGHAWLQNQRGKDWLQTQGGCDWLQIHGHLWLQTQGGNDWLQSSSGREWLQTPSGREWRWSPSGRKWLRQQTPCARVPPWIRGSGPDPLQIWVETGSGREWLNTLLGQDWLRNPSGQEWLGTPSGQEWLQSQHARDWLRSPGGQAWLQAPSGRQWLKTSSGQDWLKTQNGQDWLNTQGGRDWLNAQGGRDWLQTQSGRDWLQTQSGRYWLQIQGGRGWLQTQGGRSWLQTQSGQDWLQTQSGQDWQSTLAGSVWVTIQEFSSTLEVISEYNIVPDSSVLLAFQAIQVFKSLPDFLMIPTFLALRHQDHPTSALPQSNFPPDTGIIHAMKSFVSFAHEAWERSRSASSALKYACQNWAFHLSQASSPWDDTLDHIFKLFWNRHLLSWLEWQWCSNDLRSCLIILSEGEKLAKGIKQQSSMQTEQPERRRRIRAPPDYYACVSQTTPPSPPHAAKRQRTSNSKLGYIPRPSSS